MARYLGTLPYDEVGKEGKAGKYLEVGSDGAKRHYGQARGLQVGLCNGMGWMEGKVRQDPPSHLPTYPPTCQVGFDARGRALAFHRIPGK